jgi:hypothetical protein
MSTKPYRYDTLNQPGFGNGSITSHISNPDEACYAKKPGIAENYEKRSKKIKKKHEFPGQRVIR